MQIEAATQPASPETPTPSSPSPSPCPPIHTRPVVPRTPRGWVLSSFTVHRDSEVQRGPEATKRIWGRTGPEPTCSVPWTIPRTNGELTPGPGRTCTHPHQLTALQPSLLCSCILIKFTGSSTTITAAGSLQACEVGRARATIPLCRCGIRGPGKRTGPKVRAESKCSDGWRGALCTVASTTLDPAAANSQAQSSPSLPGRGAHHHQSVPRTGPGLMRSQEGPRPLHLQPQYSGHGFRQRSRSSCLSSGPGLELPLGGPSPWKYHKGSGFKSKALSELGGDKVGGNFTVVPGTRSTPQSDKVIRAHSPDEGNEAQRARADHQRS